MLQSSKLVLEACKSFKPTDVGVGVGVGGCKITEEIKNVGINEIKSSTFSQWILASNERRDDWTGDGTGERKERGPAWAGNETQQRSIEFVWGGGGGGGTGTGFIDMFQLFLCYMC